MPSLVIQRNFRASAIPSAVAIGNFDGLHRGHQAVIASMLDAAKASGLVPSVLTFEPHPKRLFAPEAPSFRIESLGMKLRRLRDAGVRQVFMPRFDKNFSSLSAQQFMDEILGDALQARAVITGENFAFGKGRAGNVALLREWGAARGVAIHTVPPVMAEGDACSSSAVRQALERGDVAHAGALLGRPYQLAGRVMHGDKRGRTLGFPTANIALPPGLKLPRNGIYAVRAGLAGGRAYQGAASVGVRPTVGVQEMPTLEVHLLDFDGEIYGQKIVVEFMAWVRAEEKFPSLATMVEQMHKDCAEVRQLLERTA